MKTLYVLLFVALSMGWTESRQIEFENRCGYDIWVNPLTNSQGPQLPGGITRLRNYERFTYHIPEGGWYVQHFIPFITHNLHNSLSQGRSFLAEIWLR